MAAPVIESVSNAAWSMNTSPVTITKPTGLAVGDLMLAIILTADAVGSTADEPTTPAGWTVAKSYDVTGNVIRIRVFIKTADSGDVAAANFSFVVGTSDQNSIGSMYRITGAVNATPVGGSTTATDSSAGTDVTSGTISLDTIVNDSLIVMLWVTRDDVVSLSGYTISGTNPTWTERLDATQVDTISHTIGIATAVVSTKVTITSASVTASSTTDEAYLLLMVVPPLTNVSVTPDVVSLTGALPTLSLTGTANITPDTTALTGAVQDPTVTAGTAKWTNTDKSAEGTVTNTDKS